MSRSGYSDCEADYDNSWALWRGAVNSSINGKRGQAFLRDLRDALEAKPEKTLVKGALEAENGNHCALGVIGHLRGIDMPKGELDDYFDGEETTRNMAHMLNIAPALAREIVYLNDEGSPYYGKQTDTDRYNYVLKWVKENIHG
jgi:hypothetical protein